MSVAGIRSKQVGVFSFLAFLVIPVTSLGADEFKVDFVKRISVGNVTSLCTDQWFLEYSGFTKRKCIDALTEYSKTCDDLVEPLVPNIAGAEGDEGKLPKLRNLGMLHNLCLKAASLQDGHCGKRLRRPASNK